jgi:hypothetical protein
MQPLKWTPQQKRSVEVDSNIPQFHLQDLAPGVVWPEEPFGVQHGMHTAKLALVILSHAYGEHDTEENQRVLWCAALFHDLGRQTDFRTEDPQHNQQSAMLANRVLRSPAHGVEFDAALHERVCKLIAQHALSDDTMPTDPLACALWDADAYESTRVMPGTHDGLTYMKKRTNPDRLCSGWAKDRENLKRYMQFKGWN